MTLGNMREPGVRNQVPDTLVSYSRLRFANFAPSIIGMESVHPISKSGSRSLTPTPNNVWSPPHVRRLGPALIVL
jgi:hypothetical protein